MKTKNSPYPQPPLQPPLLGWSILMILIGAACILSLTSFAAPHAVSPAPTLEEATNDGTEPSDTNQPPPEAPLTAKCAQCGVVAAMRDAVQGGQREVTVRMQDGSRHVFKESGPSIWRIGERMVIIGGAFHAGT